MRPLLLVHSVSTNVFTTSKCPSLVKVLRDMSKLNTSRRLHSNNCSVRSQQLLPFQGQLISNSYNSEMREAENSVAWWWGLAGANQIIFFPFLQQKPTGFLKSFIFQKIQSALIWKFLPLKLFSCLALHRYRRWYQVNINLLKCFRLYSFSSVIYFVFLFL